MPTLVRLQEAFVNPREDAYWCRVRKILLLVDSAINLLLGILLLWAPQGLVDAMGLPQPGIFASVFGAVLVGIAIALALEAVRKPGGAVGLGIGGAVAINLCAGAALTCWLVFGGLSLTTFGSIFLWGLVIVLVGISTVELVFRRD
jgi:hypothetical protein